MNWFSILGFGVNDTQIFLSEYEAPKQIPFTIPEIAHVAIAITESNSRESANFGYLRPQIIIMNEPSWYFKIQNES